LQIQNILEKKSDVYSYAIILWEIFSGGANPCPQDVSHVSLANQIISEGWRPSVPSNCPQQWVDLIKQCWAQNPDDRPDFREIIDILQSWSNYPPYINISFFDKENSSFSDTLSSDLEESSDNTVAVIVEEESENSTTSIVTASYDENI